ncbi:MAG: hypothetical protein QXY39_07265 [Thermofilaceae archaeon]
MGILGVYSRVKEVKMRKRIVLIIEEPVARLLRPDVPCAVISMREIAQAVRDAILSGIRPYVFVSTREVGFVLNLIPLGAVIITPGDPRPHIKNLKRFAVAETMIDFLKKPRKGYIITASIKPLILELLEDGEQDG